MKRLMLITVVLGVAALIGFPNPALAQKSIELKVTNHNPPIHLIAKSLDEAYKPLGEMTGGRVKVRLFHAGSLAKGREAPDAIVGGIADLGHISFGYFPGRYPMISVIELPGLTSSAIIATKAINILATTTPYLEKECKDFKILGLYSTVPYPLESKNRKIMKVEDIKGMRLRSAGGVQTKAIQRLGGVPVMMGSGEVYTSLARGLLDAIPYPLSSIPSYRHYEIAKYICTNFAFPVYIMGHIMNKERFAKLPPDIQKMVEHAGEEAALRVAMYYEVDAGLAIPYLRGKGMEIYEAPKAEEEKFYETLAPLHDEWVDEWSKKGYPAKETLQAMKDIVKKLSSRWD